MYIDWKEIENPKKKAVGTFKGTGKSTLQQDYIVNCFKYLDSHDYDDELDLYELHLFIKELNNCSNKTEIKEVVKQARGMRKAAKMFNKVLAFTYEPFLNYEIDWDFYYKNRHTIAPSEKSFKHLFQLIAYFIGNVVPQEEKVAIINRYLRDRIRFGMTSTILKLLSRNFEPRLDKRMILDVLGDSTFDIKIRKQLNCKMVRTAITAPQFNRPILVRPYYKGLDCAVIIEKEGNVKVVFPSGKYQSKKFAFADELKQSIDFDLLDGDYVLVGRITLFDENGYFPSSRINSKIASKVRVIDWAKFAIYDCLPKKLYMSGSGYGYKKCHSRVSDYGFILSKVDDLSQLKTIVIPPTFYANSTDHFRALFHSIAEGTNYEGYLFSNDSLYDTKPNQGFVLITKDDFGVVKYKITRIAERLQGQFMWTDKDNPDTLHEEFDFDTCNDMVTLPQKMLPTFSVRDEADQERTVYRPVPQFLYDAYNQHGSEALLGSELSFYYLKYMKIDPEVEYGIKNSYTRIFILMTKDLKLKNY